MSGARRLLEIALDWRCGESDRIDAIKKLGTIGDGSMVVALGALYGESSERLRAAVADTLDRLSAVEILSRLLRTSSEEERVTVAQVLGAIAAPTSLPALLDALKDPAAKVREFACSALIKLTDERALSSLARVLFEDSDPDVRGAAAQALGELDLPEAQEALDRAALSEADPFTVILIERSLYRFTERAAA
jgi:HEAT repeat protein